MSHEGCNDCDVPYSWYVDAEGKGDRASNMRHRHTDIPRAQD